MNIGMKTLLLILFASIATSVIADEDPPVNYDITTLLNNSIARTIENSNSDVIHDLLIFKLDNSNPINHELHDIEVDFDLEPFQNKFYFTGVKITANSKSLCIRKGFSNFETTIFIPRLEFSIEGYLGAIETTNDTVYARFLCYVHFENISIVTFKISPHVPAENKLYINMTYDEEFDCDFLLLDWYRQNITSETLQQIIKKAIPQLFRENLQHNEIFSQSFEAKLSNFAAEKIASHYQDFQNNSASYHFFIPNITSLKRTLSNITITGLWNYHSLSISNHFGYFVRNLTIKNIRGHTNLSYESQNSTIFPLRFEAEFLSIVVDEEMQRVRVIMNNYSVSQINSNSSLTEYQSKWVMGGIELAIASSIMPSIKFYRNWNVLSTREDHPIVKISTTMSQLFQTRTIKKLYDGLNISLPKKTSAESNLQLGSSNYTISINYTSRKSSVLFLNPEFINCSLYDNLQMFSELPWLGHANIRLSNSTHQFNDFGLSSQEGMFIRLTKRINLNECDDYTLSIEPGFLDADDSTSNEQNNFTENQLHTIREKAEQMFISTILERFWISARRLLSLSKILDYCTAPVKMFDDFLPFFADHELPYYIRNAEANSHTCKISKSKMTINNVIITDWTKSLMAWIWYEKIDNGIIISEVDIVSEQAKVRMNFNDNSFPSNKSKLLEFDGVSLRNETNTGTLVATLGDPSKNYFSSPRYKELKLKEKCECIIEESFKNCIKKGNQRNKIYS